MALSKQIAVFLTGKKRKENLIYIETLVRANTGFRTVKTNSCLRVFFEGNCIISRVYHENDTAPVTVLDGL